MTMDISSEKIKFYENATRVVAYLWVFISGVSVFVFPLRSYGDISSYFMYGWGLGQLAAIVGLAALVFRKPLWEWRAVLFMAFGVLCYFIMSFITFLQGEWSYLARIGDIGALIFLFISRFFFHWGEVEKAKRLSKVLREHEEGK